MKKLSLIIFLSYISVAASYAQWILGLHIQPTNPTTADVIQVYADVSFSSGGCTDKSQTLFLAGNAFYGYALHCNGMAAFICNTTDTFVISPLPAGNYTFIFSVDAGGGPSPCTPGIVAGPTDSIHFTVTSVTSINNISTSLPQLYLNASNDMLNVDLGNANYSGKIIELYNMLGKKIISQKIQESKFNINVSSIPDGIYFFKIDANVSFTGRFLINH